MQLITPRTMAIFVNFDQRFEPIPILPSIPLQTITKRKMKPQVYLLKAQSKQLIEPFFWQVLTDNFINKQ